MPSHLRYFSVLGLTAFVSYRLIVLVAADIISTQSSLPAQARELSRVEMIMYARQTAYVQLPNLPVLPTIVDEPKILASNLGVEIDLAETADRPVQTTQHLAAIHTPPHPIQSKAGNTHKMRANAKPIKLAQSAADVESHLRSPVPEFQATAAPSLKSAVQAEVTAKPEPVRKQLARRTPNAGELVRMQLLNQI